MVFSQKELLLLKYNILHQKQNCRNADCKTKNKNVFRIKKKKKKEVIKKDL